MTVDSNAHRHVITVAALKGGVGKTSTALNLAATAGPCSRVLLVDLNPQADATRAALASASRINGASIKDFFLRRWLAEDVLRSTALEGVRLIAADPEFLARPLGGDQAVKQLRLLAGILQDLPDVDLVIIDTAATPNFFTFAALEAADTLVVPHVPGLYATEALAHTMSLVERLHKTTHHKIPVIGFLRLRYERADRAMHEHFTRFERRYANTIPAVIPNRRSFREALTDGRPAAAGRGQAVQFYRAVLGWCYRRWRAQPPWPSAPAAVVERLIVLLEAGREPDLLIRSRVAGMTADEADRTLRRLERRS